MVFPIFVLNDKLSNMLRIPVFLVLLTTFNLSVLAQTDSDFKLALPDHQGQLSWSTEGFRVIESSAKPNGREIGIRGKDESGRLTFLGFLFLVPEQAPLSSAKCRDSALAPEKKGNPTLKISGIADSVQPASPRASLVTYSSQDRSGKTVYMVRGFVASGDICGDLEFYSYAPISADEADLKKIFASYRLDERYVPQFKDELVYAQILYKARMYKAAAPIFEIALAKLNENPGTDAKTMRRVVTDQAGMAYGMAGDTLKARTIFEKAVSQDPDYPLNYYNLACADAEDKNLSGAKDYLQKAFARKSNVLPGESMPDPTKDDSFLPYRDDKDFWAFLEKLAGK